jgi:cytidylate kinase
LPLRTCGTEIRNAAKKLGIELADLPDEVHQQVDSETVSWARQHPFSIVEGRFLDQVLSGAELPLLAVFLTASHSARLQRACGRSGKVITGEALDKEDADDKSFRKRVYGQSSLLHPFLPVDTSKITVRECVNRIKAAIRDRMAPPT